MALNVSPPVLVIIASALAATVVKAVFRDYLWSDKFVYLPAIGLGLSLYAFYNVFIYPFFVSPLRGLPQPKGALPVLGHGLVPFSQPRGQGFLDWTTDVPNDGLIRFRGFFNTDRVLLTSPAALKELLLTKTYQFEKPKALVEILQFFIGYGLITIEGDYHKTIRKNVMPAFAFRHIKELYGIFWDKSIELCDGVTDQIREEGTQDSKGASSVVEINHWANQVTMDIIGLAAMGVDLGSVRRNEKENELVTNYELLLDPDSFQKRLFFALGLTLGPKIVRQLPLPINAELQRIHDKLIDICLNLVRKKKDLIKKQPKDHKDILSLCLQTNSFTDQELVDQLLTFLAAGHETTSSTFTWVTYFLAKDQDLQQRLREEIYANIPDPKAMGSPEDIANILESLPLLNGVCQEVSRIFPTVPITARVAIEDTTLLGHPIPKGTQLFLCPWATNRNPDLWGPDALEFKPERWIDTDDSGNQRPNRNGGAPSNYALLTFLHGPRSCIGQGFAQAELLAITAAFCGRFKLELTSTEEKIPGGIVTTKAVGGMPLRVTKLEGWGS